MHPLIQPHFQKLESQTHVLLDDVKHLREEQYHRTVAGKWSVAQILIHLLSAEKLSLGYMQKKSMAIDTLEKTGWVESAKTFALIISQHLPVRYKAPRVVVENTPDPLPFHALEEEWTAHHKRLETFLDKIEQTHIRRKIFKHPVAGRLNVMQALIFFREHILHHLPQIKRLSK